MSSGLRTKLKAMTKGQFSNRLQKSIAVLDIDRLGLVAHIRKVP